MGDEIIAQLLSYSILCYIMSYNVMVQLSYFKRTEKMKRLFDHIYNSPVSVLLYQEEEMFQCFISVVIIVYVLVVGAIEMPSPRSFWFIFLLYILFKSTKKRKEKKWCILLRDYPLVFLSNSCPPIFNQL